MDVAVVFQEAGDADSRARCSYTSAFPINVNNVMFIVLLKQLWEGWEGGEWEVVDLY